VFSFKKTDGENRVNLSMHKMWKTAEMPSNAGVFLGHEFNFLIKIK
jgi:hypothetical protein